MPRAAAFVLLLASLAACDTRPPAWTGWVYPDAGNLAHSTSLQGFKDFESCQEASINLLRSYPNPDKGTYECGYRCRWDSMLGVNVCAETRD